MVLGTLGFLRSLFLKTFILPRLNQPPPESLVIE